MGCGASTENDRESKSKKSVKYASDPPKEEEEGGAALQMEITAASPRHGTDVTPTKSTSSANLLPSPSNEMNASSETQKSSNSGGSGRRSSKRSGSQEWTQNSSMLRSDDWNALDQLRTSSFGLQEEEPSQRVKDFRVNARVKNAIARDPTIAFVEEEDDPEEVAATEATGVTMTKSRAPPPPEEDPDRGVGATLLTKKWVSDVSKMKVKRVDTAPASNGKSVPKLTVPALESQPSQ